MNMKRRTLVTGANGFIGHNLCAFLKENGYFVRGAVRHNVYNIPGVDEYIQIVDINESTDWAKALQDVDFVVHLAGRAHVMREQKSDPCVYHRVNVLGTKRLAEQAAENRVKRFIFISSVKADGKDSYGMSKLEAERVLSKIAVETCMEVVIIRLPLVYGPGVKANFLGLLKLLDSAIPLPLSSINNLRSFIYVGNLVDAIVACINHPSAAGQTYMVSDGEDVSTPELVRKVAAALGWPARLFPFRPFLLRFVGRLLRKSDVIERLIGSLVIDSSKIQRELGWKPPYTMDEGLKETAKWYKEAKKHEENI